MEQDWVLDVLDDLKAFAQQNGMFSLAEHLDDTLIVAGSRTGCPWRPEQRGQPRRI